MYLLELLRKEVKDAEAERLIDELQNRLDEIAAERKEVMDKGKRKRLEARGWRFGNVEEFLGLETRELEPKIAEALREDFLDLYEPIEPSDPPNLFDYPGGHSPN